MADQPIEDIPVDGFAGFEVLQPGDPICPEAPIGLSRLVDPAKQDLSRAYLQLQRLERATRPPAGDVPIVELEMASKRHNPPHSISVYGTRPVLVGRWKIVLQHMLDMGILDWFFNILGLIRGLARQPIGMPRQLAKNALRALTVTSREVAIEGPKTSKARASDG
jgi:hypothetical protein